MINKAKKLIPYSMKFLRSGSFRDVYNILKYVNIRYVPAILCARLDRKQLLFPFKKEIGLNEVNLILDILGYRIKRLDTDFYLWNYGGKKFLATTRQFTGLYLEYLANAFEKHYGLNFNGKTVLDIGGFVGDSALYFLENGAKKVIVFEPLQDNIRSLSYNLRAEKNKVEVHQKAIAEQDGPVILSSDEPMGSLGFGCAEGQYKIACEGISFSTVLGNHRADIAKVDCEGAERFLEVVEPALLRSVPYWIIETHHSELKMSVTKKFLASGFSLEKNIGVTESVHLLHFSL